MILKLCTKITTQVKLVIFRTYKNIWAPNLACENLKEVN